MHGRLLYFLESGCTCDNPYKINFVSFKYVDHLSIFKVTTLYCVSSSCFYCTHHLSCYFLTSATNSCKSFSAGSVLLVSNMHILRWRDKIMRLLISIPAFLLSSVVSPNTFKGWLSAINSDTTQVCNPQSLVFSSSFHWRIQRDNCTNFLTSFKLSLVNSKSVLFNLEPNLLPSSGDDMMNKVARFIRKYQNEPDCIAPVDSVVAP